MSGARVVYRVKRIPASVLLAGWTLLVLLPLYILVTASFKSTAQIYSAPLAPPTTWGLGNFVHAWKQANFNAYMLNSVLVTSLAIALTIVVCLAAAYPLSRYRLWWTAPMLLVFLVGIMIPVRLASVGIFTTMKELHLLDSHLGLVLVFAALRIPFAMLIFAGFMRAIPVELEEAARLDGAPEWRVLVNVLIPQMRPAIGVVTVFTGIAVWNDFYFPLLFTFSDEKKTLTLGLAGFVGQYNTDWGMLFAGLTMALVPLVLLYSLASGQIQRAMGAGAFR